MQFKPETLRAEIRLGWLVLALLSATLAHGADFTWDGDNGNNWNDPLNWTADLGVPAAGDTLTFSGNTNTATTNDLGAGISFANISFTNNGGGSNFTLAGNSIVLGGNITTTAGSQADTISLDMELSGNRTITTNSNHSLTVSGVISEDGSARSIVKSGTSRLTFSNTNTYTGTTTVNAGILRISDGGALGGTAGGTIIGSAGRLELDGGITVTGETLSLTGNGGTALENVSGNNTWTGNITANTGSILRITGTSGNLTISGDITSNGAERLVLQGLGGGEISGAISGNSRLTKSSNDTGTWILSGANTYTGATVISNGTLQIGNGGTGGSLSTASTIETNNTLAFDQSDTVTQGTDFSGAAIFGTGGIRQNGTGNLVLNTNNTYGGTTVIESGGDLTITHGGALGSTAGGTTIEAGGSLRLQGGITVTGESLTLAGNNATFALRNLGGTNTWTGDIAADVSDITRIVSDSGTLNITGDIVTTGASQFVLQGNGNGSISGDISGSAAVTKSTTGTGTWTLSGDNSYTGLTTVSNGELRVQSNTALGSTAAGTTVGSNGRLELNGGVTVTGESLTLAGNDSILKLVNIGGNNTWTGAITANTGGDNVRIASDAGLLTLAGNITTTGNNLFLLQGNGNGLISGAISGTADLFKSVNGGGTWTLTGNNTYTGDTTISNGTLQVGNGGTTGTLGNGTAITNNAALAINRSNDFTIAQTIGGSGTLAQDGGGTTTLTANNTYTGDTTVNSGTLLVNGAHSGNGDFTVNNGATLGGSGNLGAGTTTINSGGTLAPGNSIGALAQGNTIWNGGSFFDFEFNGRGEGGSGSGTAGTNWDQLNITGTLDLVGLSLATPVTVNLLSRNSTDTGGPANIAGWNSTTDYQWTFVTTTGGITGFNKEHFAIDTTGFIDTIDMTNPYGFVVKQVGTDLVLFYTAVPEPGTVGVLVALLSALALRRRRRSLV